MLITFSLSSSVKYKTCSLIQEGKGNLLENSQFSDWLTDMHGSEVKLLEKHLSCEAICKGLWKNDI